MLKLSYRRLPIYALVFGPLLFTACGSPRTQDRAAEPKEIVDPHANDQAIQVKVYGPESRALPDDTNLRPKIIVWCLSGPTCPHDSDSLIELATADVLANSIKIGRAPLATGSKYAVNIDYRNSDDNSRSRIRLAEGDVANAEIDLSFPIRRIDVTHMTITRPNQTTYVAQGTATISQITSNNDNNSTVEIGTIKTGAGLDVAGGARYKVVVKANGEDGPKSYTSVLDFTH